MLTAADIISEPFKLTTPDGLIIRGQVDRPQRPVRCRCILVPAYGLSLLDLAAPAYYLLSNGFEVVRFDPTRHVGRSDGDIADFTMSRFAADLELVLDRFATPETAVLAISLSARAALRALAGRKLVGAFLLSPVVNTRRTLLAVTGEDLIGKHVEGTVGDTYEVLGFVVRRTFCSDCVDAGFADVKSATADAARLVAPTWLIAGTHDQWVEFDEVRQVAAAIRTARLVSLRGANHQIFRSPTIMHAYLRETLTEMLRAFAVDEPAEVPAFKDVVRFVSQFKRADGLLADGAR